MKPARILLGVSGGIAAYKTADLVRQLRKAGYEVRVVMTAGAEAFVSPLTFQALSGNPVSSRLLDESAEAGMGHIELAKWADRVLVAPASANTLARLANGMADDLLTTVCLATEAPIILAPAMNQAMWRNARTQANARRLADDPQFELWGPAEGDQACGDTGPGRMLEPLDILARLQASARPLSEQVLQGLRVVVTAGPTREAIDPVRYISNHSSGRMGYAMAAAAQQAGANVVLVSGPTSLPAPAGVQRLDVVSADDMLAAVEQSLAEGCDLFIATAAVADYRVRLKQAHKIKKSNDELALELVANTDILAHVATRQLASYCVGFAAETRRVEHYARDKLERKNLDMIIANDVSDTRIGFNSENNAVSVFWHDGTQTFPSQPKQALASALIELIGQQRRIKIKP
ncbi:bifunctional phosphopantothenoylcysteine decarboxylase/phosphopantothenate--cysteine ligase CoaBC [Hydrocarboniclastica marina]|uniref:Coenzyme A biosynthesis bifunctional protein CoaBC n=1 Tax=Hydrocarboniclastica marina TaxID=2259620 RepID=A0A4P7XLK6_9ALTE|nr:bifunctional phosphopantothenoylcysteine decarboxylase/phosphopantothenate--cysteine ligase CoaBC [Hydrocarboniclastica marina]MAL97396.1 bifunctional phosphopantothenoylcysteine decarboxylase/phosphopantothenate--cysteine ligase CoaBC [Alteromonadaceae bacterium]QCF27292.1 bifunctional phosphopantothenoylcysteine decarboxylase/phosphopantothenate--cysteine ligase CoaBC [Hydrocarboniclastica marina]